MFADLLPIRLHHEVFEIILLFMVVALCARTVSQTRTGFKPFTPPVSYQEADKRAEAVLSRLSLDEKLQLIRGHNFFFVKGFEKVHMPELYLSDATQGVHIRKELSGRLEKSTAFPCPLALTATWNPNLAHAYARSVGEECRAGDIAVLLGPGMNIYRVSQNGRNFEYFGEDPFLAARMIEQYVTGVQSTGTIATLKHFLCNNTEFHRRRSNSVVDERTLHEIYLPAFKAGVDAGAMAVMTSYNQINGEYAAQSKYVIDELLRQDLGFKWLVMSDWWSTWDAAKTMTSGLDLEMPGHASERMEKLLGAGDFFIKDAAPRLLKEGKISETDVDRMAKNIIRTTVAMGLFDRKVKDEKYIKNFPAHERIALQTGRESIVLLRNEGNALPLAPSSTRKILLTGDYVEVLARGRGSAEVEGYNQTTMLAALTEVYGSKIEHQKSPSEKEIMDADAVIVSVGTDDSEGWDKPFTLPEETDAMIMRLAALHHKVIVVVYSGGGVRMTPWNQQVAAILYAWYPGQNGNTALAEIVSGITAPSGKLPVTIEKQFEDSPGYPYLPPSAKLYTGWDDDLDMKIPIHTVNYREGVFVGYRWYEAKKIAPLYPFGFGMSYTTFAYSDLRVSHESLKKGTPLTVEFTVKNTGKVKGAEIAQLYVQDVVASVPRPVKELKGFRKVFLPPGSEERVKITLMERDLAFWDNAKHNWNAEPGKFNLLVGASSDDIRLKASVTLQ